MEPNSSQGSPMGCLCVLGHSEFSAACRQEAGGLEYWGSKKESLRSLPPSSHLPLTLSPLPSPFSLPCKSSLGGKVRLMITGAAPVSATVLTFLRAALGCQVRRLPPHLPLVSDRVTPRSLLSKRHSSSPLCVVFLFGRSCYS